MDSNYIQLIDAVRYGLRGHAPLIQVTSDLITLAQKHQVQNFLVFNSGVPEYKKLFGISVAQSMAQDYAVEELIAEFESHQLTIVPIKGVCTKQRYPEVTLRTMGDVDILCDMHQTDTVRKLMAELGYEGFEEGRVHDSYSMPPNVSVEVHKTLVDGESEFFDYYRDILDRCRQKPGYKYVREMSLEDEYIFNLTHLIGHFKHGGIGIRFIVDVYVYEHISKFHDLTLKRDYLEGELRKLGIFEFYRNLRDLAQLWFGSEEERIAIDSNNILDALGDYILECGIFGKQENQASLNASKGKIRMLMQSCFPRYDSMKSMFPWLKPVLLPFGWLLRAWRVLRYRRRNIRTVWKNTMTGDMAAGAELKKFYESCGLKM